MCESQENHDSVRRIVTYSMRLLWDHRNDNRQTEPASAGDASPSIAGVTLTPT